MKQCNLQYFLMNVIACICYMHIVVQSSVHVQQEQPLTFFIPPHTKETLNLYFNSKFPPSRSSQLDEGDKQKRVQRCHKTSQQMMIS